MIRLDEDYIIDADEMQFILEKDMHRVDKEDKPVFRNISYHATIQQACKAYLRLHTRLIVRTRDISIVELMQAVDRLESRLERVIKSKEGYEV